MAVKYCNLLIINVLHTSTVGTGFIPVLAAAGQQLGIINTNSTLIINVLNTTTVVTMFASANALTCIRTCCFGFCVFHGFEITPFP